MRKEIADALDTKASDAPKASEQESFLAETSMRSSSPHESRTIADNRFPLLVLAALKHTNTSLTSVMYFSPMKELCRRLIEIRLIIAREEYHRQQSRVDRSVAYLAHERFSGAKRNLDGIRQDFPKVSLVGPWRFYRDNQR